MSSLFLCFTHRTFSRLLSPLTLTLKLLGRRGEQQFSLHALRASAAGDARLLVASLHPVREPSQAAVAVQGVCTNGPVRPYTAESGLRGHSGSALGVKACHRTTDDPQAQKGSTGISIFLHLEDFWSFDVLHKTCQI